MPESTEAPAGDPKVILNELEKSEETTKDPDSEPVMSEVQSDADVTPPLDTEELITDAMRQLDELIEKIKGNIPPVSS